MASPSSASAGLNDTFRGVLFLCAGLFIFSFQDVSYLLWGEIPKTTTVIGTLMIVASGVYVLRREALVRERPLAGKGVWRSRN